MIIPLPEFFIRKSSQTQASPEVTSLEGNATLQVTMKDNGEPGSGDLLSITLWSKNGVLLFSSNWSGVVTLEQLLDGGNIQVH